MLQENITPLQPLNTILSKSVKIATTKQLIPHTCTSTSGESILISSTNAQTVIIPMLFPTEWQVITSRFIWAFQGCNWTFAAKILAKTLALKTVHNQNIFCSFVKNVNFQQLEEITWKHTSGECMRAGLSCSTVANVNSAPIWEAASKHTYHASILSN